MSRLRAIALGLVLAAAVPAMALAADGPADLRQGVVVQSDRITLGDLFDTAGAAAGVVVGRIQPGQTAVLDASRVQVVARTNGVDWGNPAGVRRIIVTSSSDGAPDAPAPSRAAAAAAAPKGRKVQVLAYLHNLNAGDIVRAEDLTWSKEAVADPEAPRDADAMIGMAARRPLREGAPASLRDVSAPQVIKKDDIVAVVFNLGGVNLTLQARAMENAVAGQILNVVNPLSKKVLQAVAVGPGQAVVGPEAEQLKTAARSPLSRIALR